MSMIARLEIVRNDRGYTGKEMASVLHIDPNSYTSIKKGDRKLHISDVVILKNILNINPSWLIFGEGDRYYDSEIESSKLTILISDAYASYGIDNEIEKDLLSKISTIIVDKIYANYQKRKNQGDRFHIILYKLLQDITYYSGRESLAKNDLIKRLENFDDKSPNLKKVKNSLNSAITQLTTKDCYYILKNPTFYRDLVYKKISSDNKKMIENKRIVVKPFYAPFKWFSKLPKI